jgi:hypothetical protein
LPFLSRGRVLSRNPAKNSKTVIEKPRVLEPKNCPVEHLFHAVWIFKSQRDIILVLTKCQEHSDSADLACTDAIRSFCPVFSKDQGSPGMSMVCLPSRNIILDETEPDAPWGPRKEVTLKFSHPAVQMFHKMIYRWNAMATPT